MSKAREAFTRALASSLGYAAGLVVILLVDVAADSWIERRAAPVDEGQALSEECPEPADEPDYVMGTDGAGRRTLRRRPRLVDQAGEEPSD